MSLVFVPFFIRHLPALPALISSTYRAGFREEITFSSRGFASLCISTTMKFLSIKIISRGMRVFRIQKCLKSSPSKIKNIPARSFRVFLNMSPLACSSRVTASSTKNLHVSFPWLSNIINCSFWQKPLPQNSKKDWKSTQTAIMQHFKIKYVFFMHSTHYFYYTIQRRLLS